MAIVSFGSLFSGIGGFDLGFERIGMQCAWQVEIDAKCRDVLAHHWPNVTRHEDVIECGRDNLGPVDLICGGFPCQDVSVAGRRAGLAGERSGLWWEFHRVIEELRPRWCVIENVPGLLSSNGGRDMGAIVGALGELRYGWAYRVLDAQYFGVAQRRRRVFIIGHLGDARRAAQVLFEPESCERHSAPSRETGARVARTIARSSVSSGYRYDANGEDFIVSPTLTERMGRYSSPDPATGRGSPIVVSPTIGADIARQAGGHPGIEEYSHAVLQAQAVAFGFSQESDGSTARNATDLVRPVTGRHGDPGCVAFQERYYTQGGKAGGAPSNTVDITNAHKAGDSAPTVAFRTNQTGARGPIHSADITDTLAQDHPPAVLAFQTRQGWISEGAICPPINAGGGGFQAPSIAFTERTRDEGRTLEVQEELNYALTDPGSVRRAHSRLIAYGGSIKTTGYQGDDVYGEGDTWPTLSAEASNNGGGANAILHSRLGVRRLTPVECERLQGFPDGHTEGQSDSARYRQLGNAVAVPVAQWIGHRIMQMEAGLDA